MNATDKRCILLIISHFKIKDRNRREHVGLKKQIPDFFTKNLILRFESIFVPLLKINLQMTKNSSKQVLHLFSLDFSFWDLIWIPPLGVKEQSETSQKDKMAGPAIVNSENVT